ncbi:cell envelope integrity EipB family protein [Pseudahrensia aquimaris]|uniref:Cell envelope integrity EipB family protein n=1 Tax=Pseudahrensia aquimaris TaxID=744461 RepID=A0ABW3FMW1_9HYPH
MTKALFASVLIASLSASSVGYAASSLKPHRAVYDLVLDQASNRSGITSMEGRIVYEVTGSACEGFASRYRFQTEVRVGGKDFINDQRNTTFESGDGTSFNFVTQYYLNGQLEQDMRGAAEKTDEGLEVKISKPEEREVVLEDAVFMNTHMEMIMEAATKGETVMQARVFDGSDDGDSLVDTTTIIGVERSLDNAQKDEPETVLKALGTKTAWPVSVSYFNADQIIGGGERIPHYQISFLLQSDGISRDLKMRYTDYSLFGTLVNIEYLPSEPCN